MAMNVDIFQKNELNSKQNYFHKQKIVITGITFFYILLIYSIEIEAISFAVIKLSMCCFL